MLIPNGSARAADFKSHICSTALTFAPPLHCWFSLQWL